MVIKPVRLFCYIFLLAFWAWLCTTFNSNLIILNLQTNKIMSLIYSATICKQRTLACQRASNINQSPLLTMIELMSKRTLKCIFRSFTFCFSTKSIFQLATWFERYLLTVLWLLSLPLIWITFSYSPNKPYFNEVKWIKRDETILKVWSHWFAL